MRRWLAILAVISLLISIAAVVAWALTRREPRQVVLRERDLDGDGLADRSLIAEVRAGHLHLTENPQSLVSVLSPPESLWGGSASYTLVVSDFSLGNCSCGATVIEGNFGGIRTRDVMIPLWWVATATAILPALMMVSILRARRRPLPGCCPTCGYDPRATPERCPECGTAAEPEVMS